MFYNFLKIHPSATPSAIHLDKKKTRPCPPGTKPADERPSGDPVN